VEETNRKIVALLAGDGRLSFTELARQSGLSGSAVQQRVRRLEDLLQEIRAAAGVSTRTTIVLSTPYEGRPPDV